MKNDDRRGKDGRGFKPQNPPRPARRTYNIPPASHVDADSRMGAQTLPVKPGSSSSVRTFPAKPGNDAAVRTLPSEPRARWNDRPQRGNGRYQEDRPQRGNARFEERPQYGDKRFQEDRPQRGNARFEERPQYGDKRFQEDRSQRGNARFNEDRPQYGDKRFQEDRSQRGNARFEERPQFGDRRFQEERSQHEDRPVQEPRFQRMPRQESPAVEPPENLLAGRNPIREALKSGAPLEKLLVSAGDLSGAAKDIVRLAKDSGIIVQYVERHRLDQIYPTHQGMLAFRSARAYSSLEEILEYAKEKNEDPLVVVLDQITDPHNLGAIIRSAECAGAHGVIIPERRAVGLTPACEKAAAGALNYMRVARVKNTNRALAELKDAGLWIVAAALDGEDALSADLTGPLALVIGSEGDGISRLTLSTCDRSVALPMIGKIESLNASVAAGILLYEVVRGRRKAQ